MASRRRPHVWYSWLLLAVLLGVGVLLWRESEAADEAQEVTSLPGQPQVNFKHYAGYITVNQEHGRALFYWFFQSSHAHSPSELPLVLWLNGGPGCSSVGNGALSELGPFFTNNSGTGLFLNEHAWNTAANIIFLESPFGTGFSYSKTYSDYARFSDEPIAEDAHAFLVGWFKKFPEYAKNEFYLVGESYAGHYIPTLARVILRENRSPNGYHINFKGFAVGNPWTDAFSDNFGTTQFYHSHSLISDETYEKIQNNCDFQNDLPVDAESSNATCNEAVREADNDMLKIDIYNVYGLACNRRNSSGAQRLFKFRVLTGAYDPCLDSVTPYLNLPTVQSALHVNSSVSWTGCSDKVFNNYTKADILQSMIPVYQELLKEDLRIWVYSGDADGVVSTVGTRKWIKKLNLPIEISWYAWDYQNQVGGWTQKYKGLTFASIRGAGHLVPAVKPGPALAFFKSFLAGQSLPKF